MLEEEGAWREGAGVRVGGKRRAGVEEVGGGVV